MALLEFSNVSKGYGDRPVLRNLSFQVEDGEFLAFLGFSGSGKTTLINLMAGLALPDRGEVRFKGAPITGPGPERGLVFQSYALMPWLTVAGNIALAVDAVSGAPKAERAALVQKYMQMVGLGHAADRRPAELSGGMRQRVAVARALAMQPEMLLMDEPLSALDALTRGNVATEIESLWAADKRTAVLITNDVDEALVLADRILCLNPDGTLGATFAVNLPRPRDRNAMNEAAAFKALRADVTAYLMDVGIKSKLPETRALPSLTPRHALPKAYAAAAISPVEARYLRYSQLHKVYATPKGPLTVVEDFNLVLKKGEFVSLIGHSGCGKSTVLTMTAGLNAISKGAITLDGTHVEGADPERAVVFQSPNLFPWLTAKENVAIGVDKVYPKSTQTERQEVVEYYLERVGLADAMDRPAADMSNGMRQRVGIARAFALSPKLLLLDEPFGMLDSLTRWELQEVLMEVWSRTKVTAVCVTHDVDEAILLADRVVMMTNGPNATIGKITQVTLPRPRSRRSLLEHPDYYHYRAEVLAFLEEYEHGHQKEGRCLMKRKLVVIGAGMASGRVLEHLTDAAPDGFDITLFNAEPRGNYNRIMLSPVLSGEKTYAEIVTHDDAWYGARGITTRFGAAVTRIDRAAKTVTFAGQTTPYDDLIIATGSAPFIIPVAGKDLPGVVTYRDLEDTNAMIAAAKPGAKAVVIGGGLLGLEAAAGMQLRGMDVTVIHLMGHLMERQLDPAAGYLLQKSLEARGMTIHCKGATKAILGHDRVEAVLLEDGTIYPADLVCMAVGIRPEVRLANDAHLDVGRGITVNDALQTSDPSIWAVGECVEHDRQLFGLVAPLYDQAKVLAQALLGQEATFRPVQTATKLKVTGCDLFSAGDFADAPGREDIVFRDPARGVYKRLVIEGDQLIGAVMYGDTADGNWFFGLIKDGTNITPMRDTLIFGPAFQGGATADPMAAVAALPPSAEICGCNGVCKGKIVDAILAGSNTLDLVRSTTKASASCGTCTGLVEQVLAVTLGDSFAANTNPAMCKCTDHTHEDVRRLIKAGGLKSIPAVLQELGWKTAGGCASCRPALNYYLLADWPTEYRDDRQSRFANERNHANIQKDGTYSVVPRMWGGVTTPAELRAIADAADKYNVPMVKVTGGQRIDLLGVKKSDLPLMWQDLNAAGMVSGHAYSKGLRTVKTCVGSEFCRFGTQDSTGLGIKLEKLLWGSWTPAKVKLGVSGCPRNCAEATCKDIGVICVESGYEISVAGAAGMDVRETEPLFKAATEAEAMEVIAAFVQLYRENSRYLHRIYKWVAKVGLDWCRAQIADPVTRRALYDRFMLSQSVYQIDPWADLSQPDQMAQWAPLVDLSLEAAE